jgi:hypothetical protein
MCHSMRRSTTHLAAMLTASSSTRATVQCDVDIRATNLMQPAHTLQGQVLNGSCLPNRRDLLCRCLLEGGCADSAAGGVVWCVAQGGRVEHGNCWGNGWMTELASLHSCIDWPVGLGISVCLGGG